MLNCLKKILIPIFIIFPLFITAQEVFIKAHDYQVFTINFSSNGEFFYSSAGFPYSKNADLKQWTNSGKFASKYIPLFFPAKVILPLSQSNRLISAGGLPDLCFSEIILWTDSLYEPIRYFKQPKQTVTNICISPSEKKIMFYNENFVEIRNIENDSIENTIYFNHQGSQINFACWYENDDKVLFINNKTNLIIKSLNDENDSFTKMFENFEINYLNINSKNNNLLLFDGKEIIIVFNIESNIEKRYNIQNINNLEVYCFNKSSSIIAYVENMTKLKIINFVTSETILQYNHSKQITVACFSPFENKIVIGDKNGNIVILCY